MEKRFTGDLKLSLTAFLVLFSLLSFGQDWKFIGQSGDGSLFYYNVRNSTREGDIINTWIKSSIPNNKLQELRLARIKQRRTGGFSTKGYETYSYTISHQEYDCNSKKVRFKSRYDYNSKGVVISDYANIVEGSWKEIVPSSMGEDIFYTLCREAPISDSSIVIIDSPGQNEDHDKVFTKAQLPAEFPGGIAGWTKYLERNLNRDLPVEQGAPPGKYTVYVSFIVDTEGNISDVKAENDPGYGTKDEAVRVILKGPNWKPATLNGSKVIYRHKQGITFVVTNE